ncbi:vanillate O-demethylase ferredoxin subunit [Pseudoxanthomonas sp. GM95]|uniref:PDR/VanB family oxidoreductase n=1 Tax=Pseudoxanthomonas sp. GM95 TaxID=1881043 RepID=UPI0008C1297D|nr:PDR/VanB family oxidoreductase [Pseudoxanthomonas sp. GM95]SEK96510.1 vanillate O-demethylase ferredoxin subunit [Pseudoxanthomonas sp. GM95]
MQTIEVVIDAMSRQGAGNLAMELVRADGAALPAFEAGAHVDVHLPGGLIRQYSIASTPADTARYVLCVRREAASRGGSSSVHERLRVGQALTISAPRNLFALQPGSHHVLVAGGIGITPLLAMAHQLQAQGASFELHYYVRSRSEIAFLRQLHGEFGDRVHLHSAEEGRDARQVLPEALEGGADEHQLYLCGPAAFMAHITEAAMARGWDAARIHDEAFAPVKPLASADAGDEATFEVEVASTGQVFTIAPDRTIAAVLGEAGIALSLSCEMGICGACLTDVVDGIPDHRDTVQSDVEKASNKQVTVCCSRSCSPRLTLAL